MSPLKFRFESEKYYNWNSLIIRVALSFGNQYGSYKLLDDWEKRKNIIGITKAIGMEMVAGRAQHFSRKLKDLADNGHEYSQNELEGVFLENLSSFMINEFFNIYVSDFKLIVIHGMKAVLERISHLYLPIIYVDLLTCNTEASMRRSLEVMSRYEASSNLFFTSMWSSFIYHLSSFIYEVTELLFDNGIKQRQKIFLIFKQIGFRTVCIVSGAFGYAVGSYFEIKYVAPLCGVLMQGAATAAYDSMLRLTTI